MSEIVTHRRTRQLKGQLTDLSLRNLTTRDRPYKVAASVGTRDRAGTRFSAVLQAPETLEKFAAMR